MIDSTSRCCSVPNATGGAGNTVTAFRRAIESATHLADSSIGAPAGSVASNLDQLADSLAELLKPDTAAMLVDLGGIRDRSSRTCARRDRRLRWTKQTRMPDHSLRVEIALWEKDVDAAWRAAHEASATVIC